MPAPFTTALLVLATLVCVFASPAVGIALAVLAVVFEAAVTVFRSP